MAVRCALELARLVPVELAGPRTSRASILDNWPLPGDPPTTRDREVSHKVHTYVEGARDALTGSSLDCFHGLPRRWGRVSEPAPKRPVMHATQAERVNTVSLLAIRIGVIPVA
jgi:hypothetical protein